MSEYLDTSTLGFKVRLEKSVWSMWVNLPSILKLDVIKSCWNKALVGIFLGVTRLNLLFKLKTFTLKNKGCQAPNNLCKEYKKVDFCWSCLSLRVVSGFWLEIFT
jgi:hypothetical protein